jgi:non-specific serine/threonine protein kinase/serine/threonine-protein kinase
MGEVWLAEQVEPLRRTVAVKLIKAGMDTKAVIARFESERQALALMEHPCIAKVFDAGSTAEGRPYFVMEYVPGQIITEYCDKHRLTLRDRLNLFTQVCEGVQHAHQKAIIHRDLKPSNVLVEEIDNKPVPKIIDFGLAKATAQRLTDAPMYTEVGTMVGTPAYMSPEQADRNERNIDTRTDVYSLGVILYQLLAGVLPFEANDLSEGGLDTMLKRIRDEAPPRPSTKVRSQASVATTAGLRQEEPQAFVRHLRGELDWIVMKALEKDRARRYGSPSDMAADIRRYLANEPVLAGPPSTVYRAKKFVQRHRFGVAAAVSLVALLIAFAVTMAVQAKRIARERDRANREAAASKRVSDFMTTMFKVSDPSVARGNAVTAREILDKASHEIETGLSHDPELQARLMTTMGDTYTGLGLYPQAAQLDQQALDIARRMFGPDDRRTLDVVGRLGWALSQQTGHEAEAEKMMRENVEKQNRLFGKEDADTLSSQDVLASILKDEGHFVEAEQLERETYEAQRRVLGSGDMATIGTASNLANSLTIDNKYADAEQLVRENLDAIQKSHGAEHPAALFNESMLGDILKWEGKLPDAEKLDRDALEGEKRVFGKEHPTTLTTASNLGDVLLAEEKLPESEQIYRETYETQLRVEGKESRDTLTSQNNLASVLIAEGRYKEAEQLFRAAYETEKSSLGEIHPDTLYSMSSIGVTLSYQKRYPEAERLFQQALAGAQRSKDPQPLNVAWYQYACGAAVAGKRDQAFQYLQNAVDKGYDDSVSFLQDKELISLRGDSRFQALADQMKSKAKQ